MASAEYAIGIDLGTANTCVAVYHHGHVEIIPDEGRRVMPSYVAFTETGRLIGAAAKNQAGINPQNTVFNALRLIGRKFTDSEIQADMKHSPFKIFNNAGKPVIGVDYRGNTDLLTPEDVLSMILDRARVNAEAYLGFTVDSAVITVPSYFTTSQRQSIRDAALVSKLQTLYLINAPSAATCTYALDYWSTSERNLLVVDLGASALDAALITIEEGMLEVKATASDTHLSGEDFDNRFVHFLVREFEQRWKRDITSNPRALRRLRTACERAKRELSSQEQTHIQIDALYEGIDFNYTVTRARFVELCQDLFRNALDPIERVLRDARMDKSSVQEIVVVGGSSRIPRIQKLLSDFFNGKEVCKSLHPDEAAAGGAAIYAAMLSRSSFQQSPELNEFLLLDVAPFNLGIETAGGTMTPLVKRNTIIPIKGSETFSTSEDNETSFHISVFEGELTRTKDNMLLGKLSLPLPPAPRGVPQIQVTLLWINTVSVTL